MLVEAVLEGALSVEAAAAIVDALGDAPDRADPKHVTAAERALVAHATGERGCHPAETDVIHRAMPPEMLAKVARGWRDAMNSDGVEPTYEQQRQQRYFSMRTRSDGSVYGNFACPADQGGVLLSAGAAHDPEAVEAAAAGEPGRTATIERTGEVVPIAVAAAIACDNYIQSVVLDADGVPLYLGRKKRFFNRSQRRAIAARDGGCRGPGCGTPVGWCDAHHVMPWNEGGKTDISNGILLCQHHHPEVHRGMLEIVWASGGWVVAPKTRGPRRKRGWSYDIQPDRLYAQGAA